MAAAAAARPVQVARNRRDGVPRTGGVKGGTANSEKTNGHGSASMGQGQPSNKRRKLTVEPHVRTQDYILNKYKGKPVSMTVHLHQTYFRFENQEGSWAYDSPMRFVVQHLRQQTIPHGLMEELLDARVPFYDGCLIVEVHNHRQFNGKDKARPDSAIGNDQTKFSMNNFTNYITPSPFAPYPQAAKVEDATNKPATQEATKSEQRKGSKEQSGPHVSTIVLHPTTLSRHKEIELAARTRAVDLLGSSAEQSTPSNAVTSGASRTSPAAGNRMIVDAQNAYEFEAKLLLYTEPPLFLEPVSHPEQAQKVLDLLSNPLHDNKPPSPKVRKRTTAQMAADDAQAAEAERRMLMMDERIKPSVGAGATTSESQGAAASLGISRFKTIQMAKEKIAEQETLKKAEEAQAAAKRRQQEEAHAENLQRQQQQKEEEERRRQTLMQRTADARVQKAAQQAHALAASQAKQAQAQVMAAQQQQQAQMNHALAAQTAQNNLLAQHQSNLQHGMVAQNSPIVRQQTPMVNSSPMMPQGFPASAASQAAGSPPRPASATMPHPMVRQASQQQVASRHGTPPVPQGTPSMQAQTMANRAVSQTPRATQASPVPGTPVVPGAAMPNIIAANRFTPEQLLMMQHQKQSMINRGNVGPGTPGLEQSPMTPQQIQMVMNRNLQNQQMLIAQANDPSNPQAQNQARMILSRHMQQRATLNAQRLQAANPNAGLQGAQQVAQAQALAQAQAQAQAQASGMNEQLRQQQLQQGQREVQQLVQQFGNISQIPQQMLSQHAKFFLVQRQQAQRSQMLARQAQHAQSTGQTVAGGAGGNPEYMQQLQQQAMLLQQQQHAQQQQLQQQQQQQSGTNPVASAQIQGMAMGMGNMGMMGMNNMQQQFGTAGQQQHDFTQQFAAMQNALNQSNRQQNGMQ
ncbi:uncharacterized protein K489DRAFT_372999 [Dissoconium aciculare CBS 342.82]|uniref:Spt20-like SEP domain-containing protein n=1 Tax=Dissoconium aciculare CBS 342.82 TaxID=1314786 RepID=A0A6J3LVG4_9PEZI|nr:uncharacterized protein K489DRAFT_372999 [Dissoconium aciculare CBS 342.82]KAF1819751.1 hypothetical protein K489DRAFT_372999 [Dissoconium aciculare CBS 342.82]